MEIEALAVERRMLGAARRISGVVRLATSELFAGFLLPAVLDDFLTLHPEVEVEIDVSSRAVYLTRREADLALRASNAPAEDLIGRQVGELRYAVYGQREQQPVSSLAALAELPWLGSPRMNLWVLSHGDTRDNARVRALAQHLARQLPRVLAARQKQDASRA